MAFEVTWTEAALAEFDSLLEFIAEDSPYYAAVTEEKIQDTARSLVRFPYRARIVPEFERPEMREVFIYGYRMIFKVSEDRISILSVVHSARDLRHATRRKGNSFGSPSSN